MKRVKPAHLVTAATLLALGCGNQGTTIRATDSAAAGVEAPPDDAIADTMSGTLGPVEPTDDAAAGARADSGAGTAYPTADTIASPEDARSQIDSVSEGRSGVRKDAPARPRGS